MTAVKEVSVNDLIKGYCESIQEIAHLWVDHKPQVGLIIISVQLSSNIDNVADQINSKLKGKVRAAIAIRKVSADSVKFVKGEKLY